MTETLAVPAVETTDHLTADVVNGLDFKVADLSLAEFGRKEITSPSTRCPD